MLHSFETKIFDDILLRLNRARLYDLAQLIAKGLNLYFDTASS